MRIEPFELNGKTIKEAYLKGETLYIEFVDGSKVEIYYTGEWDMLGGIVITNGM